MKKPHLPVLLASLLFFTIGCKKKDASPLPDADKSILENTKNQSKGSLSWETNKEETQIIYSTVLKNDKITNAIVTNGLVLVYKGNGNTTTTLPFTESANNWYYQVRNGAIEIFVSKPKEAEPSSSNDFKYLILSKDQLDKLQLKGLSKVKIMGLSFDELVSTL